MGKQIPLFPPPPPTADERLNSAQAQERRDRMLRDATRPEAPASRDRHRSRRRRDVRAKTISVKRLPRRELEIGRALYPEDEHEDVKRPRTRDDCEDVPRPCPFVSCRHHLYLDVSARSGAIKLNFPDLEPDDLPPEGSCALDVAERGGITLEALGATMNLTRDRIRQLEVKTFAKLAATRQMYELREHYPGVDSKRRRLPVVQPDAAPDTERDFDAEAFSGDELDE